MILTSDIIFPFAMTDPDSRATLVQRSKWQNIDFIRRELIPEMVHDRYFCEPGSREFVEFGSADVELLDLRNNGHTSCELYRVMANVKFSGETCSFPLIVKLPRNSANCVAPSSSFQNEEMFYNKMMRKYRMDGVPKCYLSDLGRYGRPAIVLEDLAVHGYVRVDRKLNEDHLKLCVKALAMFHGRGLRLRAYQFSVFREFYAKLSETCFNNDSVKCYRQNTARILDVLKLLPDPQLIEKIKEKLNESPIDIMENLATEINDVSTICHGHFSRDNVLFKYEHGKPSDVKVIDWQTMKYCSPAIDLGFILFANLPDVELAKVKPFCRDILRLYLNAVKHEYPEVACEFLERDIIAKLLLAYIILCVDGKNILDSELVKTLHVLNDLGTFD